MPGGDGGSGAGRGGPGDHVGPGGKRQEPERGGRVSRIAARPSGLSTLRAASRAERLRTLLGDPAVEVASGPGIPAFARVVPARLGDRLTQRHLVLGALMMLVGVLATWPAWKDIYTIASEDPE